jgi:Peptidase A4 family
VLLRRISALAAAAAALVAAAPAQAATSLSTNWAGYVASGSGATFRHVSGTWVVPALTCTDGRSYSAHWVGLGGYHSRSQALEQIGTEADCTASGGSRYTAWYELVPSASVRVHMTVAAGDQMSASVAVAGRAVTLRLVDVTRGKVFSRTLHPQTVDTSSADWIVEAPSVCDASGCATTPLANFGLTGLSRARATTASGHTGPISDPAWTATAINLSAGGRRIVDARSPAGLGAATTGGLAASGDAFAVAYTPGATPTGPPGAFSGPPGG